MDLEALGRGPISWPTRMILVRGFLPIVVPLAFQIVYAFLFIFLWTPSFVWGHANLQEMLQHGLIDSQCWTVWCLLCIFLGVSVRTHYRYPVSDLGFRLFIDTLSHSISQMWLEWCRTFSSALNECNPSISADLSFLLD